LVGSKLNLLASVLISYLNFHVQLGVPVSHLCGGCPSTFNKTNGKEPDDYTKPEKTPKKVY